MKIEVGMYVRVKGYIGKICNINEFREPSMEIGIDIPQANDIVFCGREDITRVSNNILDLIECGDVIVGKDGHKFEVYAVGCDCVYINELKEFIFIDDIKAIITREQIEADSYRIGDDDLSNCG